PFDKIVETPAGSGVFMIDFANGIPNTDGTLAVGKSITVRLDAQVQCGFQVGSKIVSTFMGKDLGGKIDVPQSSFTQIFSGAIGVDEVTEFEPFYLETSFDNGTLTTDLFGCNENTNKTKYRIKAQSFLSDPTTGNEIVKINLPKGLVYDGEPVTATLEGNAITLPTQEVTEQGRKSIVVDLPAGMTYKQTVDLAVGIALDTSTDFFDGSCKKDFSIVTNVLVADIVKCPGKADCDIIKEVARSYESISAVKKELNLAIHNVLTENKGGGIFEAVVAFDLKNPNDIDFESGVNISVYRDENGDGVITEADYKKKDVAVGVTIPANKALGNQTITFKYQEANKDKLYLVLSKGANACVCSSKVVKIDTEMPLPLIDSKAYTTEEDKILSVTPAEGLLKNADATNGKPLAVVSWIDEQGITQKVNKSIEIAGKGNLQIATNGAVSFTPVQDFNGEVNVEFWVSNQNGQSKESLKITVTPVIDTPTVKYTVQDGTEKTATVTVGADGTWTVPLAGQKLKAGTEVQATLDNGTETSETAKRDVTAPNPPVINPVNGEDPITGTAEPGAVVTVTFPDTTTKSAVAKPDGTWTVENPGLNDGDVVKAVAKDDADNVSDEATATVDAAKPAKPTIDEVSDKSTKVTGTGEPGATVTVTLPDGSTKTATVKPDGTWEVPVLNLTAGETVTAKQTDLAGNDSDEETVTVKDKTAPVPPVINEVTDQSTKVTGTGEPGATVTVTLPDGGTKTATVQTDGTWEVPVSGLTAGQTVKAKQADPAGNVSGETSKVVVDATAPNPPTINPVNATAPIKGTAEPGTTVTVTFPDGSTKTATVKPDGTWEISNPGLNDGQKIEAKVTDGAGNESTPTEAIVDAKAPDKPVINPVNKTNPITGTAEPGTTVTVTFPDG
ncbi:MAG: hypothetical protein CR962_01125, partial [Gammaproteobacteria bacterium]